MNNIRARIQENENQPIKLRSKKINLNLIFTCNINTLVPSHFLLYST